MAVVSAEQRVAQLARQAAAALGQLDEALAAAQRAGFSPRWGVVAPSAAAWQGRLAAQLRQGEAEEAAELAAQAGAVRAMLGTAVHRRLAAMERELVGEAGVLDGFLGARRVEQALGRLDRLTARLPGA